MTWKEFREKYGSESDLYDDHVRIWLDDEETKEVWFSRSGCVGIGYDTFGVAMSIMFYNRTPEQMEMILQGLR